MIWLLTLNYYNGNQIVMTDERLKGKINKK